MAQEVLLYLSFIIAIAAVLTVFMRAIKQPPIIAYLIAGIIVGPLVLNFIGPGSASSEIMQTFAHIGVAFLLFIVGLSLDFRMLKDVGAVAVLGGTTEIALTAIIGGLIVIGLGFSGTTALYLAAALAFSSTVVVVKILSDKKEIDTLHGRIALGILIVEDFVAAIALMALPLIKSGGSITFLINKIILIIILICVIFLASAFVLNSLLNYLARNQEVLFLFGISWALLLATLFYVMGFSLEIGALVAGISLASSKYTMEVSSKIKPLRDFFVVLFFVFIGSQLSGDINSKIISQAVILSLFVIIGKPIIVMSVLRIFGYRKRTNFLAGSSLAQISEFSLILILLGFALGHVSKEVMNLAVLVALITIGISSYNIYYAHTIFQKISHLLNIFENKIHRIVKEPKEKNYDILLFGYHRLGYKILETLKKLNMPYAVVEYNPKVILALGKEGINCIYGDASDPDFLSQIPLEKTKLIISTIPDISANLAIEEQLKKRNIKAAFLATAEQPRLALTLYQQGVDYVIVPHHLGGDYAAQMIKQFHTLRQKYRNAGSSHKKQLRKARNNSNFE